MVGNGPENRDASKGATEFDSLAPRHVVAAKTRVAPACRAGLGEPGTVGSNPTYHTKIFKKPLDKFFGV